MMKIARRALGEMTVRKPARRGRFPNSIWKRILRLVGQEHGNAMIELAIVIPIFLLVAVGAADYARVYFAGITVTNAARAGAQYGFHTSGDTVAMRIAAEADAGPGNYDEVTAVRVCRCPGGAVVTCSTGDCGAYGVPQAFDSVRVRKDVNLIIHYLGLPATVTVARSVVFRPQ